MAVEIKIKGEVVYAYLSGELDHHSAAFMRQAIDSAIELNMPTLLIMDFENITFMDSSGIGLVMGRYRNLAKSGAVLNITGVSRKMYKMMEMAGLNRLAKIEQQSNGR